MPGTYLNYPFNEEIFYQMWQEEPDPVLTAMLTSGAVVDDAVISNMLSHDGNQYTIPFYNVLEGEPVNYDGGTDITATETTGGYQSGIAFGRAKGFTARDFVAELSGADPMGHIAGSVAKFWQKYRQKVLVGILDAVFGITGASGNAKAWHDNHVVDLSSDTASARTIGATDLNDVATAAMGDHKSDFAMVIMHSNVSKTLENMGLLEFWKYTDANGIQRPMNLASVNGYTAIIDDSVPTKAVGGSGANKDLVQYTTYLLGRGCVRRAPGRLDTPVETERSAAKNGGQDTLYTRIRETIHPNGFSFKIPTSNWTESPTDAQLFATANWELKFNPKAIPMAKLITNG